MTTKSISQQIYDEFIEELSTNSPIDKDTVESLKKLLKHGNIKKKETKKHIVKILKKEEETHEDP